MKGYTGDDVVRIAVEKERKRLRFYSAVAKRSQSEALSDLFEYLAEQERGHIQRFQSLLSEESGSLIVARFGTEEAMFYIDALLATDVFGHVPGPESIADEIEDEREAIRLAMGFEKDAILFFDEMLDGVQGPAEEVVREIIEEEKRHLRQLYALAG